MDARRQVRRLMRALWAMSALTVALSTASCGAGFGSADSEKSQITLESAKSKVVELEQEIAGLVPEDLVVSVQADSVSGLMGCDDGRKKWTGDAEVTLAPGADHNGVLDDVVITMTGRDGWAVEDGTDQDGDRRVDLLHSDGTHLLVSFYHSPETLRVAGYSACFDFPEYAYGEDY